MAALRYNAGITSEQAGVAAVGEDIGSVSVWTAATGGTFLWGVSLSNNPDALTLGQAIQIAANALVLNLLPGTGQSDALAIRMLSGVYAGGLYMQFHDSATFGASGTQNVANVARVNMGAGSWTVA